MKRLSEVGKKLYMEFGENTGVLIQQGLKGLSKLALRFMKSCLIIYRRTNLASQTGRGALLAFYLNNPAFIVASY